jgi:hypothetical protein
MLASDAVRSVALLTAAAASLADAPALLLLAPVVAVPLLSTVFRPAQIAVMPLFASSEQELMTANAHGKHHLQRGHHQWAARFNRRLLIGGTPLALGLSGLMFIWSAAQLMRLPRDPRPERTGRPVITDLLAGLTTIACHRPTRTIACAIAIQGVVMARPAS